jgi:hypothetical protein
LKKMAIPEGTEIVLEKSFFKFEMKIHFWNFKKNFHTTKRKWKNFEIFHVCHQENLKWNEYFYGEMKKWNEEIICLCQQKNTTNNTSIPPYTTCACCGGIQLISTVISSHTNPFETMVGWYGPP